MTYKFRNAGEYPASATVIASAIGKQMRRGVEHCSAQGIRHSINVCLGALYQRSVSAYNNVPGLDSDVS